MRVEQIYTGCLAHGAYYITSGEDAAIIDPLREIQPYLDRAAQDGVTIRYVFETHFHADFVSGHVDLAKATGATIVYGPTTMKTGFEAHIAHDGEEFQLGAVRIRLLHTPGHTLESSCYLLLDEQGQPNAVFTGDTLFIGDVGRPDLAQKLIAELTQEKLASHLYDSLRMKLMTLPDAVLVYPGHGAGSACGKKMSKETVSTIGEQKASNYALRADMTRDEFIHEVLTGLTPPPQYFPANVLMNIQGYPRIDSVVKQGTRPLSPAAFEAAANETEAVLLDTRNAQAFAKGFIPNAINIGLDGQFASWVGTLIPDLQQPILLVTDPGREEEAVIRLARVGYDHAIGYLQGGFDAWVAAGRDTDRIESVSADALAAILEKAPSIPVLDVRRNSEYCSEHLVGAMNVPLDYINDNMSLVQPDQTYYVHCAGGYRSMTFISILRSRGFHNLVDVQGGFQAMKATGRLLLSDYVCPTTLL